MIGFIFAGFRINDILQSWPLEFSCYAFSVNRVKKMREAESFGCKKIKQNTSNNRKRILSAFIIFAFVSKQARKIIE